MKNIKYSLLLFICIMATGLVYGQDVQAKIKKAEQPAAPPKNDKPVVHPQAKPQNDVVAKEAPAAVAATPATAIQKSEERPMPQAPKPVLTVDEPSLPMQKAPVTDPLPMKAKTKG